MKVANGKLFRKLAKAELLTHRRRTAWTLLGIILSTALITAVCSFAASGNALVADLLGAGYGDRAGTLAALLLIPAGILSAIVVSMSVIVISNAFRVSAGERIRDFGLLKTIGATKRQIVKIVLYESYLLCAIGIPVGLIVGLIIAFAGVGAANLFLGEINSLVHMMMTEITIVVDFVIAWQALTAAALISFLAILLSAWLPACKAARIPAIESIRGAGEIKVEVKRVHTNPLVENLFGFEGTLAAKNMKRNRRKFRASVVSLTAAVIMFIALSSLSEQAGRIEGMMFPDLAAAVMVDYTSLRDTFINSDTGREETIVVAPINSEKGNEIAEKLREYEGSTVFGIGDDMETYYAVIPREMIAPQMMDAFFYSDERQDYEVSAGVITVDMKNYAALCEQSGVPIGSNILLNRYDYNDNGKATVITPFLFGNQNLRLMKADNSVHEMPVHGILAVEDIPNEFLGPNVPAIRLIVPNGETRNYTWFVETADIAGFMDYANGIMAEMFPQGQNSAYMELGFTTRIYEIGDYMKVMNIAIVLGTVFVYGFVILLTLIGLTGVINTISANIRSRAREFAVLRSIGMTHGGLKRMLNLESILYSVKALMIGLPVATVLTYFINIPIRSMFPIPYRFPWFAAALCVATIFALTWVIIRYCAFKMRGGSVTEKLREVEW
jgi:putative ABC transport system permease protein